MDARSAPFTALAIFDSTDYSANTEDELKAGGVPAALIAFFKTIGVDPKTAPATAAPAPGPERTPRILA